LIAFQRGNLSEAEQLIQKAILKNPSMPAFHNNLGQVYRRQGKLDQAIQHYQRAIELNPNYPEAHNNLGSTLYEQGEIGEAIHYCRKATELNPSYAEAHSNLGSALNRGGQMGAAIHHYRLAIELNPKLAEAHNNLGNAFFLQGQVQEARRCYTQAVQLKPQDSLRIKAAMLLPPIYSSKEELQGERERLSKELDQLLEMNLRMEDPVMESGIANFYLVYQGLNDRDIQEKLARLFRRACRAVYQKTAFAPLGKRIKVGFISSHFHNHTIGKLMRGVIANLSRERFEVTVFSIEPRQDFVADSIRLSADRYAQLPNRLEVAAQRLLQENMDILFYPDIGMHPLTYFLAFSRFAPVQCVTWGHPVTTGIDTMDDFISTMDLETPESDNHYTEKLIRLASSPTYYYRPNLPFPMKPRSAFGLPDDKHVYLCPQSLFKFHPDFDLPLSQILREDPQALLVLIAGGQSGWREALMARFLRSLTGLTQQVHFLPYLSEADFLNLNAVTDVVLDTYPFGGGNTTYEALAAGSPVVTLPTDQLRGRISYSLYKKMNLMDCVVQNPEEYAAIALRLGTNEEYRRRVRKEISDRSTGLYEDIGMVRQLESYFIAAIEAAHR